MCLKDKEKNSGDSGQKELEQGNEDTQTMQNETGSNVIEISGLPHHLTKKQILDKFPIGTKIRMHSHAQLAYLEFESREEAQRALLQLDHDLQNVAKTKLLSSNNPNSSSSEQIRQKSQPVLRHMIKVEKLSPEIGQEILQNMFPHAIKIHIDRERCEAQMEFESAEMKERALHRQYVNVTNLGSQSSIAQGQGRGRGRGQMPLKSTQVQNKKESRDENRQNMFEAWDKPFSLADMIMEPGFVGLYNLPPDVTNHDLMDVFPNSSNIDIIAREKEGASAILEFLDASRADEVYHKAQKLQIGGRRIKAKIIPSGSAGKKIMLHINSKEAAKSTNQEFI